MSSSIPSDFIHHFQDKYYLESQTTGSRYKVVGSQQNYGKRMFFGPFCIEYYTGDNEPVLESFKGLRFIIWAPVTRVAIPSGWYMLFKKSTREVSAFIDIRNIEECYKLWNNTFRTYVYHFSKQDRYAVESISCDHFCELYTKYAKKMSTTPLYFRQLQILDNNKKSMVNFYTLKDTVSGEPVAGVATSDCFSVKQSYYIAAFTRKDIAPKEAGLWLLNHWMKESSKRGILYANFGNMWVPGKPSSWKGFSDFKMKFRPMILTLKPELVKITFSLK